jgi:hypothetical protein
MIKIPFLLVSMMFLASWSNPDEIETDSQVVSSPYTNKQFWQDAYDFKIRNNLEIPDHYYDELGIDNPNIPAYVKVPATEHIIQFSKLRDQVPEWVRKGILFTETRSVYKASGLIKYVDQRRGQAGDIGPFQMRRVAFDDVKKRGESFWKMEQDVLFAEEMACRYLLFIYNGRGNKNWETTVLRYNAGPYAKEFTSKNYTYLNSVKLNGKKI